MTHTSTEQERAEFEARFKHLDLTQEPDSWGAPRYKHDAISLAWEAWQTARRAQVVLVPQGWKSVQIGLLERIQESLGSFISDQGWSQSDMDTADALAGLLAAAPQASPHGMEQDAARYQALVESGNFAPSPFDNGMWGLRASSSPSTKAELDAAVDRVIAAQAKQGGM